MKSLLDSQSIELSCPNCARKFKDSIGKLKTKPLMRCTGCGNTFSANTDNLRREIAKIEKSLTDLTRTLGRIGK